MQSLIQMSHRNAPRFAVTNLCLECCSQKVEFSCPIEGKSALTNISRVLGGVGRDRRTFIVYAIREGEKYLSASFVGNRREKTNPTKNDGVRQQPEAGRAPRFLASNCSLAPVAFDQDILAMAVNPVVGDPALTPMGWLLVVAGRPDIMAAVVAVIAGLPYVSLPRRRTEPFVHRRGWPDANHDLRK